eukprot:1889065-Amphidinium_carterae.1
MYANPPAAVHELQRVSLLTQQSQDHPGAVMRCQHVLHRKYHPTAIHYRINSPSPKTGKNYRN